MSEQIRQSLSALIDDEGSELEFRQVLQQIDTDPQVADKWGRYQLIGSALRGELGHHVDSDLGLRVQAALREEPHNDEGRQVTPIRYFGFGWRSLASVAVAASVTLMVIVGAQHFNGGQVTPELAQRTLQPLLSAPIALSAQRSSGYMQAQYGQLPVLSAPIVPNPDIIRQSPGMDYYLHQHHSLMKVQEPGWAVSWVPEGFSPVRHTVMSDSEVILYTDGRSAFSVCIEAYGRQNVQEGVAQFGDEAVLGKRVRNQFVTVVGDVPLMIADRIASSVDRNSR